MVERGLRISLLSVLSIVAAACGGGGASAPTPPPAPQIAVQVTPASATMLPGETQQFAASVTGTGNSTVSWAVNGVSGGNSTVGTVSSTGLYTSPATPPANPVTVTATSAASASSSGSATVNLALPRATDFAASRFLDQSSFGATPATIRSVKILGIERYLLDQFNLTALSTYPDPIDADPFGTNSPQPYQLRFLTNALTGQDQLRQRTAFALQKLWVVSWVVVNVEEMYLTYLRMHHQHAFSTYRQIMENVTRNPAMGQYQDIANNDKADPARGINCNENYGRELMQLFTIGVWELNQDGTLRLDGTGNPIPSYDQEIVEGNACAITGWTYVKRNPGDRDWPRPFNWTGPLEAVESHHDTSAGKTLLNGFTLPAGQTAAADLRDTLDNLFQHSNVPPFVSKMLIQQFTTSNPSPAYVGRVAQAFAAGRYVGASQTYGTGARGDMQAVIAAILLDAEARAGDDPANVQPDFGKLREPVLFVLGSMRSLGAQSDGAAVRAQLTAMGQNLFFPPTVFSYFSPEYAVPGTALLGPEFNIQNTATALVRANFANAFAFGSSNIGAGTTLDFTPYTNLAAQGTDVLLDELNRVLLHGTMSAQMRASITTALNAIPASNPAQRARNAIYLVITSSQYQVQR